MKIDKNDLECTQENPQCGRDCIRHHIDPLSKENYEREFRVCMYLDLSK